MPGSGHYAAAKAGMNIADPGTSRKELGPRIRVNCIMPGAVPTEIMMTAMKLGDATCRRSTSAATAHAPARHAARPRRAVLYFWPRARRG